MALDIWEKAQNNKLSGQLNTLGIEIAPHHKDIIWENAHLVNKS